MHRLWLYPTCSKCIHFHNTNDTSLFIYFNKIHSISMIHFASSFPSQIWILTGSGCNIVLTEKNKWEWKNLWLYVHLRSQDNVVYDSIHIVGRNMKDWISHECKISNSFSFIFRTFEYIIKWNSPLYILNQIDTALKATNN